MSIRIKKMEEKLSDWKERYHTDKMVKVATELPVRRDMVTLLTFVNENKVVGTQSTGNMPLKMVRAVTAKFVNPPILDTTIGDHTYRLRTEADVWPLYFLHILAEVGSLLKIEPGRRWRLMRNGKRFLNVDPLYQISFLLSVWWYEVNWIVAFPYSGIGDKLPRFFNYHALEDLLSFQEGTEISMAEFAGKLIEETGLTWEAPNSSLIPMILHTSIERMIVLILSKFGVVECEYREESLGNIRTSKLQTFKIVPFGRALLEAMAIMSR